MRQPAPPPSRRRDGRDEYRQAKARGYASGRMTISVSPAFHGRLTAYATAAGDKPGTVVEAVLLCVLGD